MKHCGKKAKYRVVALGRDDVFVCKSCANTLVDKYTRYGIFAASFPLTKQERQRKLRCMRLVKEARNDKV